MEQQYSPQLERYLGLLDRSSSLKKNIDRLSDQYTSLTTFDTMRVSARVVPEQGALVSKKATKPIDGSTIHRKQSQTKAKSSHLDRRNTQIQQKDTNNKKGHVSLPLMNRKTPQEVHFSQLQRALSSATVGNKAVMTTNTTTSVFPIASMSTSFRIPERSASTIRSSRNSLRFSHKDSMDILNAHLYKDEQGRWTADSIKEKSFFGPKAPQYPLLSSVYKNVPSTSTKPQNLYLNRNTPPSPRPIHPSIGMYDLPISQLAMPITPDTSPQSSVKGAVRMTLSNTSIPEEGSTGIMPSQKQKTKGLKGFLTRNLPGRNNKLFGILNGSPETAAGQRERAK